MTADRALMHEPIVAPPSRVDDQNPWPGLNAFEETAQRFFNGRTKEAAELRRLIVNAPLTVVFGASGLGKTSLLQAGLFPLLRQENMLPVYVRLDVRDRAAPLINQVTNAMLEQFRIQHVDAPAFAGAASLWEWLHQNSLELWSPQNQLLTPLFVLDQFEEVFTLGSENAKGIARLRVDLADLIENRLPAAVAGRLRAGEGTDAELSLGSQRHKVLVSFREDFLPAVEGWKRDLPSMMRNRLRLLPMSGEQAFEAVHITAPHLADESITWDIVRFVAAAQADATSTAALDGRDDTDLAVEPALLSLLCRGLNERRKAQGKSAFDRALLQGTGQAIISDYYKDAVAGLPRRVQRFVERELITERGFRKPCDVDDARTIHGVTGDELRLLVDRRLLRIEPHQHTERVELTHDLLTGVVREHRTRQRERERGWRAALFAVAAVVLAGLTVVFALLYRSAARQQREAEGRRLAAESEGLRAERASLLPYRLLLAIESMRGFESVEADRAIRSALSVLPRQLATLPHQGQVSAVAVQPGVGSIVTAGEGGDIAVWSPDGKSQVRLPYAGRRATPIVFSADGRFLAVVGEDGASRIWEVETRTGRVLRKPDGHTMRLAFSVDGTLLASSNIRGGNGSVTVWKVATGELVQELLLDRSSQHNQGLAFSKNGLLAAVAYNLLKVWDIRTWSELSPTARPAGITSLLFSPEGNLLVAAGSGKVSVMIAPNMLPHATLELPGMPAQVAFTADGKFLGAGGTAGETRVWKTEDWTPVVTVRHEAAVTSLAFSQSGALLATGSDDGTAALWDPSTGVKLASMDHAAAVRDVSFSADGNRVIASIADGTMRIWEAGAAAEAARIPDNDAADTLAITPAQTAVVRLLADAVHVWRPERGMEVIHLPQDVRSSALSANGALIAVAGVDDIVRVQNILSKQQVASLPHSGAVDWEEFERRVGRMSRDPRIVARRSRRGGSIERQGFSPDGRYLYTARTDFFIRLWEVATARVLVTEPYGSWLTSATFSPDGRVFAVIKDQKVLEVFELPTGRKVVSRKAEGVLLSVAAAADSRLVTAVEVPENVQAPARLHVWRSSDWRELPSVDLDGVEADVLLSPTGTFLAVRSPAAAGLRLVRLRDGVEMARLESPEREAHAAFSPNGKLLVVAGDRTALAWDLKSNREWKRFAHYEEVLAASFSPDSRWLATGVSAGARIFSIQDGVEAARLNHGEPVRDIRFSSDGKYIVTVGAKSTRVWLWQSKDLVREACDRLNRHGVPQWPLVEGEPFETRLARACRPSN